MRKGAKLEKRNTIELYIQTTYTLGSWTKEIKKKVGAQKLTLKNKPPASPFETTSQETIKGKEFVISFKKL